MSDTIQARHHSARQATLLQQRPSALIDAAERFHQPVQRHLPMKVYGGGQGNVYVIDAGVGNVISEAITSATQAVVLVDVNLATSAGEAAVEVDDYNVDTWLRWAETTRAALQRATSSAKPAPNASARLRVERLTAIQAIVGLPIMEMAQVLGITRQALYKWLDVSKDTKLQEASRERLALVERVAKQWRERSTAPLNTVVHEPLANGRTVLDMMVDENIDEAEVLGGFEELMAKLQGKPRSRSQKLEDAGFKRRPSPRTLPADE